MPLSRTVNYRKWKSIDVPDFSAFVDSSLSCFLPSDTVLSSGLDSFAPMKSRTVAFVRSAPWYTDELRLMKAACRKLERRWRISGLSLHNQAWKEHLHEYKAEIISVRSEIIFLK